MHQIYRSTIGKGSLIIFILTVALVGAILFLLVPNDAWIGLIPLGLVLGYITFLYASTKYHLTPEHRLKISAGFKQKEIDIFQISSLRSLTNYLNVSNVYALSENRIRVVYGYGDYVDISPQHPEQFIKELLNINPRIQNQSP